MADAQPGDPQATAVSVTVDPRKCVASQTCLRIAPLHFELAPESHARPTRAWFAHDDLDLLYEAEDSCPTGAIEVHEGGG